MSLQQQKPDLELSLGTYVDLSAKHQGFSSLDDLLKYFDLDYELALLNDVFIRTVVRNLSAANMFIKDYGAFLSEVNPLLSARYLVAALADPARVDAVSKVLLGYGPSRETVGPLVAALADPARVDAVSSILLKSGPSRETVGPLVGALASPERVGSVSSILLKYGPSRETAGPLVAALKKPISCDAAENVLAMYEPSDGKVRSLLGSLHGSMYTNEPVSTAIIRRFVRILSREVPSSITVKPLVATLDDPVCVGPSSEVLSFFGPSEITVPPLIGALKSEGQRGPAKALLIGYGERVLGYILPPRFGNSLYLHLTEITNAVKAK